MYEVTYIYDAYCGWCYALAPALHELASADDVTVSVLHGSLFSDERAQMISAYPHIPDANERISAATGVEFGPAYRELLSDGTFVVDSDRAAAGLAALKLAAPGRDLELAAAMQRAFYLDGLSLSDGATYRRLAEDLDIDAAAVTATLDDGTASAAARREQNLTQRMGVTSYPTLAVSTDRGLVGFGSPIANAAQLRSALERAHG